MSRNAEELSEPGSKARRKKSRSRLWCFTMFDILFDWHKYYRGCGATYIAYGTETCPTTGKKHLQGFVYFDSQRCSVKQVASELGGAHVEMCRGSLDQQADYCSKEGKLTEIGERPSQGKRSDLVVLKQAIERGDTTVDQICLDQPLMVHQYGRTLDRIEDIVLSKRRRDWMTKGFWLWGTTGVGKSYRAFKCDCPENTYAWNTADKSGADEPWACAYRGEPTVIMNEFRGQIPFERLMDLVDWVPTSLRRRGRDPAPFLARRIVITSSLPPERVYEDMLCESHKAEFLRRFTIVELQDRDTIVPGLREHPYWSKLPLTQKCSEGNTVTSEHSQGETAVPAEKAVPAETAVPANTAAPVNAWAGSTAAPEETGPDEHRRKVWNDAKGEWERL